jgi:hypothetical protein
VSLREQIAALTKLLSIGNGRDRRRHIPSPHESEEDDAIMEDEDEDPLAELRVHRHQPLVQAQANRVGIRFQTRYTKIPKLRTTQRVHGGRKK